MRLVIVATIMLAVYAIVGTEDFNSYGDLVSEVDRAAVMENLMSGEGSAPVTSTDTRDIVATTNSFMEALMKGGLLFHSPYKRHALARDLRWAATGLDPEELAMVEAFIAFVEASYREED